MPLKFGNTNIEKIVYNGVNLDKVIYNGVVVWESWKDTTTKISKSVSSSSGGWDEWYSWSSGWINLSKPIKNPTGYVYISTNDTSASNARGYVRYADGTEEMVAHKSGGYHGGGEYYSGQTDFTLKNNKEIIAYKIDGEHKKFSGSTTVEIAFTRYLQKG